MKTLRIFAALLVGAFFATPGFSVWGTLDKVPSATLIVPFFEVGIDPVAQPQDTRPVIYSRSGPVTVHWEVYDIDGEAIFWNSRTIGTASTWAFSMRDLIDAEAGILGRAALADGDFYRGFMTIDLVMEATDDPPFDSNYPFAEFNALLGYVYYTRLAEGSANGLALPGLEYTTASSVVGSLVGFYGGDRLEEMDTNARTCIRDLAQQEACTTTDNTVTIRSRVFQSNAVNGNTRIIVFAWDTSRPNQGGPSAICNALGTCATEYVARRFRENGTIAFDGTVRLDHVVNIIDTPGAVAPGEHIIVDVEDPGSSLQLFAFSFNSASPAGNPNINWDAIFESSIDP